METKTYMELIEIIEGQRTIISQQATSIIDLLNQCAEQENIINVLMTEFSDTIGIKNDNTFFSKLPKKEA